MFNAILAVCTMLFFAFLNVSFGGEKTNFFENMTAYYVILVSLELHDIRDMLKDKEQSDEE